MLRISSLKDLLPFRPQEDLLRYEERRRKAGYETKKPPVKRTAAQRVGAYVRPTCIC
jgi:hypothetical protein